MKQAVSAVYVGCKVQFHSNIWPKGKISETTDDYHLPISRWLLTYLNNKIDSYVSTVTKHKRYGVVIYKTSGDLLLALSKALHDAKHTGKTKMQIQQEYRDVSDETTLETACSYINKLILREIDILSNNYSKNPDLYAQFKCNGICQQHKSCSCHSHSIADKAW